MNIQLEPGTYVVAVSGGVDSMVLLDLLTRLPHRSAYRFVVAHFDHGIRKDSALDRQLVEEVAASHHLPFVHAEGRLGAGTSEDQARQARYMFLRQVCRDEQAKAILTAHHQDDVLETAIHNMLRGTNRRGLVALRSRGDIIRPLLEYPKHALVEYAVRHGITWREDATNQDIKYRRNYIRHTIMPRLSSQNRTQLLAYIAQLTELDRAIEHEVTILLKAMIDGTCIDRVAFICLPHAVSKELMVSLLHRYGVQNISTRLVERLVVAAKTYVPGKLTDIDATRMLKIESRYIHIMSRDC